MSIDTISNFMLPVVTVNRTKKINKYSIIDQFIDFLTIDIKKDLYILCTSLCMQF